MNTNTNTTKKNENKYNITKRTNKITNKNKI